MRVELTPKILHMSNTPQTMGSVQHNDVITVKMVDVKQLQKIWHVGDEIWFGACVCSIAFVTVQHQYICLSFNVKCSFVTSCI